MKTNLHVYPSNFTHETRILKETRSLAEAGIFDRIVIGAIWDKNLLEHESLDQRRQVWRVRLATACLKGTLGKLIRFTEWYARILCRFRGQPPDFINCHSLSVLPLGMLFQVFLGTRIIYDTHELETETQSSVGIRKKLAKLLERALIKRAVAVFVVSESIARWYRDTYLLENVHVIRNFPERRRFSAEKNNVFRKAFGISENELVFLYQGILDHGRGISLLLRAFAKATADKHVVFLGYGPLTEEIKAWALRCKNIRYHPAVPPEKLHEYTASADVGLALIENTCLSYFYSLPNKLFEYIFGGVPVIVSDLPEMASVVMEHDCGWVSSLEEEKFTELINGIPRDQILEKRANTSGAQARYAWDVEQNKMLEVYRNLLSPERRSRR